MYKYTYLCQNMGVMGDEEKDEKEPVGFISARIDAEMKQTFDVRRAQYNIPSGVAVGQAIELWLKVHPPLKSPR